MYELIKAPNLHVTSHVSDPLPAAAGLAVIDVIEEEGLVEQARQRGDHLLARLYKLQQGHEQIGDVRGKGLLVGIELVEDRATKKPAEIGQPIRVEFRDLSQR